MTAVKQKVSEVLAVKRDVRARDGFKCTKCGTTNAHHRIRFGTQLEVHRLTPGSLYTIDGCVSLCHDCHAPQPRRKKGERRKTEPWHAAPIQLPPEWHQLLKDMASESATPANWLMIVLLKREAEARGKTAPVEPWRKNRTRSGT